MKELKTAVTTVLFLLTATLAGILGSYLGLKESFSNLKDSYNNLLAQYEELHHNYTSLKASYTILAEEYTSLEESYEALAKAYNDSTEELEKIRADYLRMKEQIYDWITEGVEFFEEVEYPGISECYNGNLADIPCINHIEGYTYQEEAEKDRLKTPQEFILDNGGDCEDFAFYYYCLLSSAIHQGYGVKLARDSEDDTSLWDETGYQLPNQWIIIGKRPVEIRNITRVGFYCSVACSDTVLYSHCVDYICTKEGECIWFEPETGSIREPCRDDRDIFSIEITSEGIYLGNKKL